MRSSSIYKHNKMFDEDLYDACLRLHPVFKPSSLLAPTRHLPLLATCPYSPPDPRHTCGVTIDLSSFSEWLRSELLECVLRHACKRKMTHGMFTAKLQTITNVATFGLIVRSKGIVRRISRLYLHVCNHCFCRAIADTDNEA